jgi:hypothetical protein
MHVLIQITKSRLENKERKWSAEKVGPRVLEKGAHHPVKVETHPPSSVFKSSCKAPPFLCRRPTTILLLVYSLTKKLNNSCC